MSLVIDRLAARLAAWSIGLGANRPSSLIMTGN